MKNNPHFSLLQLLAIEFAAGPASTIGIFLFRLLYGVLPALYVVVYASFIDRIIAFYGNEISWQQLYPTMAAILAITLFQYCGRNLSNRVLLRNRMEVEKNEKLKFIKKCKKLKYKNIETSEFCDLMHSVQEGLPDRITSGVDSWLGCVELVVSVVGIMVVILNYSVFSALILAVAAVPMAVVSVKKGADDYGFFVQYDAKMRRAESFSDVLVLPEYVNERNTYRYGKWFLQRWRTEFDDAAAIFLGFKKKSYVAVKLVSFLIKLVFMAVIALTVILSLRSGASIGICTMLIGQIMALSNRITWDMSANLYGISEAKSYLANYNRFYAGEETKEGSVEIGAIQDIRFENVRFRYEENADYVLDGLNLELTAGKTYAFVGENGAGKTTIMKLLLGLYDDYEGTIKVNGVELREIRNLNERMSAVFQDYAEYQVSAKDNVCLGMEEFSREDYDGAARMLRLSLDPDTELGRLGEKNFDLSGGQWQKLAMIRALLHPGEFYILDEPTAALDPVAENEIYRNFKKIIEGKMAVVITHRLGAARIADEIFVIREGKASEHGTHEDLCRLGGTYADMYETQRGWYIDEATA